jgi:hypothetical protein
MGTVSTQSSDEKREQSKRPIGELFVVKSRRFVPPAKKCVVNPCLEEENKSFLACTNVSSVLCVEYHPLTASSRFNVKAVSVANSTDPLS